MLREKNRRNLLRPGYLYMTTTLKTRVIARLDVKGPQLIKGVQLEGLRVVGDPFERACEYYRQRVDELIYIDIVASLYNRNTLNKLIERTAQGVFIPLTVGGGIRSIGDAREVLRAGADKVALNTAAIRTPNLISEIATRFGRQCVVVSIEAKRKDDGTWEALVDSGRERTGLNAVDWAVAAEGLGAGEILLTSVDRDGTRRGYDIELTKSVSQSVSIPVIASGGFGIVRHAVDALSMGGATAVAIADGFHFNRATVGSVKSELAKHGYPVR